MPLAGIPACCAAPDAATRTPCIGCGAVVCKNCRSLANGKVVCAGCRRMLEADMARESAGLLRLPFAILGGLLFAAVAGGAWAVVAIACKVQFAWAGMGLGFFVGRGVYEGAGKKRGFRLQVIAICCAALGLLLSKYIIIGNAICDLIAKEGIVMQGKTSILNPEILKVFFWNFGKFVTWWDPLWLILALLAAWVVPAPTRVKLR